MVGCFFFLWKWLVRLHKTGCSKHDMKLENKMEKEKPSSKLKWTLIFISLEAIDASQPLVYKYQARSEFYKSFKIG